MYHYQVVIKGLEKVSLRTTLDGVKELIGAFHNEPNFTSAILEQIDRGTPFKNGFVQIKRVVEDQPAIAIPVNFAESLEKVKAKFLKPKAVMKKAVLAKVMKKAIPGKKAVAVKKKAVKKLKPKGRT